jgi:hypothetical protein
MAKERARKGDSGTMASSQGGQTMSATGGRSLPRPLNPRLGLGDSGLKPGRFLLKHGYPVIGLHVLLMSSLFADDILRR